jgi:hypothetical protein
MRRKACVATGGGRRRGRVISPGWVNGASKLRCVGRRVWRWAVGGGRRKGRAVAHEWVNPPAKTTGSLARVRCGEVHARRGFVRPPRGVARSLAARNPLSRRWLARLPVVLAGVFTRPCGTGGRTTTPGSRSRSHGIRHVGIASTHGSRSRPARGRRPRAIVGRSRCTRRDPRPRTTSIVRWRSARCRSTRGGGCARSRPGEWQEWPSRAGERG